MKVNLEKLIEKAALELAKRGIALRKFNGPERIRMYSRNFILPPHDEKEWFKGYVQQCLEKSKSEIKDIARESYALLRYKQALAGSSDGTPMGSLFAMLGGSPEYGTTEIYEAALRDFDSRENAR